MSDMDRREFLLFAASGALAYAFTVESTPAEAKPAVDEDVWIGGF